MIDTIVMPLLTSVSFSPSRPREPSPPSVHVASRVLCNKRTWSHPKNRTLFVASLLHCHLVFKRRKVLELEPRPNPLVLFHDIPMPVPSAVTLRDGNFGASPVLIFFSCSLLRSAMSFTVCSTKFSQFSAFYPPPGLFSILLPELTRPYLSMGLLQTALRLVTEAYRRLCLITFQATWDP